jgi:hypothetical protein
MYAIPPPQGLSFLPASWQPSSAHAGDLHTTNALFHTSSVNTAAGTAPSDAGLRDMLAGGMMSQSPFCMPLSAPSASSGSVDPLSLRQFQLQQPRAHDEWMQQPFLANPARGSMDLTTPGTDSSPATSSSAVNSWLMARSPDLTASTAVSSDSGLPELPTPERIVEMINAFFTCLHNLLPSVHRQNMLRRVSTDLAGLASSPFLWVVMALNVSHNKTASSQPQYRAYMSTAHAKLELMSAVPRPGAVTGMLQASLWIIFDTYRKGDITAAWLLLGKTVQLMNAAGLTRIDGRYAPLYPTTEERLCSDIEIEEQRKCIWCLALIDRIIASGTGSPLCLDDRHLQVDLPFPDADFQSAQNSVSK